MFPSVASASKFRTLSWSYWSGARLDPIALSRASPALVLSGGPRSCRKGTKSGSGFGRSSRVACPAPKGWGLTRIGRRLGGPRNVCPLVSDKSWNKTCIVSSLRVLGFNLSPCFGPRRPFLSLGPRWVSRGVSRSPGGELFRGCRTLLPGSSPPTCGVPPQAGSRPAWPFPDPPCSPADTWQVNSSDRRLETFLPLQRALPSTGRRQFRAATGGRLHET